MPPPPDRCFLFLQGPHGPFFDRVGRMLARSGARVLRVGFNRGDERFWSDRASFVAYDGTPEAWPDRLSALLDTEGVTDIVLYGDTRPVHAAAVAEARARGLTVHVFEEGYLRPYWITYERGGSNGHSRLMQMTIPGMRMALERSEMEMPAAPARWGDMRHHVFYGALYHFYVMALNGRYRGFRPHRGITVLGEFRLHLARLLLMPVHAVERMIATQRIRLGGFPYHLVLMQLAHDASFRMHGPFATMTEFIDLCLKGFAEGAPRHHHLVFKAHPLEDGRSPVLADLRRLAAEYGVADRVHFVRGGKLAALLNQARSAVTVNSTAAQQVLWRGLPLKVFGAAVYSQPEFCSPQPLPEFFAQPRRPDSRAYRDYRHYLLETSQVPGGFYSARGRRHALRQVIDMMLAPTDPYDALAQGIAAPRQQLVVVQ
ncbi:capsule biosynthesis protein CapA [Frigidibacter sp. MR17.14]|uniref:capsule biosynthesis protein n=1 Tax=Frigidibacter sp. MR17.14 TaxID=3126509 RepID=UPI0030131C43